MNEFLNLQGFGPLLAQGAWMTVKLAFLALVLSLSLGLIAAGAKLSSVKLLRVPATLYTTLIRSVPDLVLILLIFYSLQLWLNDLSEMLGWAYFEIDPFTAGVITLGFIYGAYFTENFRGAILSVPAGQLEAATAYALPCRAWAITGWCCSSPRHWCRSSVCRTWSRPRKTPARPPTTRCTS
jgi:histidine transport system permease protein